MKVNPTLRAILSVAGVLLVLALLRFKPWQRQAGQSGSAANNPTAKGAGATAAGDTLKVGFLPVTCHLTCPITDYASKTTTSGTRFESQRFTDWPTVAEAFKSGQLQASFFIAPLAMKMREQGVPCKIVYLGHRDGSTVMVRKDDPAKSLADLKGKQLAVPSRFSNQYLVIRKLMEDQGVSEGEGDDQIHIREMAPPDMPTALAAHTIDSYFVGEPHAAKAELDGTGRVLYHAKDIWPHFISCVLVVSDKLIAEHPAQVRDLVRGIAESGEWAETHRLDAAKLAAPYFRQNEKLVRYVLTTPPDRVSYRMLTPTDADLQQIEDMALKANILQKPISMKDMVDRQFVPAVIAQRQIAVDTSMLPKP